MTTTGPKRESRETLAREPVLAAAIHLADRGGIASLSMRRLAEDLGVGVMSLYYYFPSKDGLLSAMLDVVFGEMELPASGRDWQAAIRSTAVSARDVLLSHPWACQLLMSPTAPSPARLRWMNAVLGRLREAGFSAEMTHHAYHAVDSHVVGFVLWVLPYLSIAEQEPDVAQRLLEQVPLAELPHLAEHIEQHTADRPGDVSEFEFGLDLILDGLERLRLL